MQKLLKKLTVIFTLFIVFVTNSNGVNANVNLDDIQPLSGSELIEIVDPYIEETFNAYEIINADELRTKIGQDNYNSLIQWLEIRNKENQQELNRDAVSDYHIQIIRATGAIVEYHWWGKRIKTISRSNSIAISNLASAFSSKTSQDGLALAIAIAIGGQYIPGAGHVGFVAGLIVGFWSWADAETWSRVSNAVANNIYAGKYVLTIDINGWYIDVQVY